MKPYTINLLNSFCLITMGIWAYASPEVHSPTALIPALFGILLLLCHFGLKKENKFVAHIAVGLTFLILIALVGMRLPKSLDTGGVGLYRVLSMILTSSLAIIIFIKSFINARRNPN